MACGCIGTCSCNIIGDGETADVVKNGDTFVVSALPLVKSIADTACIDLSVTPDGELSADPILDPDGSSVVLECGPDGLTGDVVIDPSSTADVSVTPDGLRVNVPPPDPTPDATPAGTLRATAAIGTDVGWADADGSEVSRDLFEELHDALSLVSTTGIRTMGSAQITGILTRGLGPGMPAEISGFSAGLVVVSIDSATALTVDSTALTSGADTEVRVYPHGNGDGGTTFNLPLVEDDAYLKQLADGEAIGASSGDNAPTLTNGQMPPHEHPGTTATDSGHGHGASALSSTSVGPDGAHAHGGGSANDSDFVTVDHGIGGADYRAVPIVSGGVIVGTAVAPTQVVSIPTIAVAGGGIVVRQQTNRAATNTTGTHNHIASTSTSVAVDAGSANITVDVALEGDGDPLDNRPLSRAVRWVVKL